MALEDPDGDELIADEQPVPRHPQDVSLADLRHEQWPDTVDQRYPGLDQDQRTEVRISASDRRRRVHHRRHSGLDETFRGNAVEILVVDHRDVPGVRPGHQVLRAPVDPCGACLAPTSAGPAAGASGLGRGRLGLLPVVASAEPGARDGARAGSDGRFVLEPASATAQQGG